MNDWERFSETLLPEKEDFYSHLNMAVTYPKIFWEYCFQQGTLGKKEDTLESLYVRFEGREMVLNGFKNKIFPLQPTEDRCNTDM